MSFRLFIACFFLFHSTEIVSMQLCDNKSTEHIFSLEDQNAELVLQPSNSWVLFVGEVFDASATVSGINFTEMRVEMLDVSVANFEINDSYVVGEGLNLTVSLRGLFLGRTAFNVFTKALPSNEWFKHSNVIEVVVKRNEEVLDRIFISVVALLVVIINIGMGCKIELTTVKSVLKKPIAPVIGFVAQFGIMPSAAFFLGFVTKLPISLAFGLFGVGCSPGGSASNIYTLLFNGDISLSVTMTLISTVASFAMIPLWMYTLGEYILSDSKCYIKIPYSNIITTLIAIIVPVGIGMLIKHFRSNIANKITKILKIMSLLFIVFVSTFGVYANQYMFKLFRGKLILAGALLPYFGLLLGGLLAKLFCQDSMKLRTIAIETGIQNTGIAILLMRLTLPNPESDIASVPAVVCSIFTPVPLVIAYIIYEIYKYKSKELTEDMDDYL